MISHIESDQAQQSITRRYDRIAGVYDLFDRPLDLLGVTRRRKRLLAQARGTTLEVGVGTGRNLGSYPSGTDLTGIDASAKMLAEARQKAKRHHVTLERADVQRLPFADATFDTVTATCVFCSVSDPIAGLREVARVVKDDGQVLLLEHVRPRNRLLGWLADRLTPIVSRLFGPAINRRTEDNVEAAGLDVVDVRRWGVWREIKAVSPPGGSG